MRRNEWKDFANWHTKQLNSHTKSQHHALTTTNSKKKKLDLLENFVWNVLADSSEMSILGSYWKTWFRKSVNKLVRVVTKWFKACDKRLARLISHIHLTCEFRQYCYVGTHSTTMQIRIVSRFWFCVRLWRLKINIRWTLMHFRKSNICANKLYVQETDISLTQLNRSWGSFSGCRFTLDGIPALDLRDLVIEVFHSPLNQINKYKDQESQGNRSRNTTRYMKNPNPTKHVNLDLNDVDYVPSNAKFSRFGAMLYIFEDNEAVIKMIIKDRSPTMRQCVKNPQSCSGLVVW